jgi:hypothetical protein
MSRTSADIELLGQIHCIARWELWVLLQLLVKMDLLYRLEALSTDRYDKFTHAHFFKRAILSCAGNIRSLWVFKL